VTGAGSRFDADTAATDAGGGLYHADVDAGWNVGERPNGGYLAALVARTVGTGVPHPDPITVTTHYLRSPVPGPVSIDVEVLRSGKRHTTAMARMEQEGTERLRMLATFGDLSASGGRSSVSAEPPALPPLEECVSGRAELPGGTVVAIMERFDIRFDPATVGWVVGRPSGRAEIGGWLRFADQREPDPWSLLLVVDAFPPTTFSLGLMGWVPTVELTTHVRARPAPGWLRVWIRTRVLAGGYLEEDAEVWDSTDTLVAMSRQLALVPST